MEIQDAVDLPRIVDNTSNTLRYTNEGGEGTLSAITPEVVAELQAMGHVTECAYDQFGYIQAITYGEDGKLYGAADVWADGRAVGF